MARSNLGTCRYCNKTIIWARTAQGRNIPLDPEDEGDGEWVLIEQADQTFSAAKFDPYSPAQSPMARRFRGHKGTCTSPRERTVDGCQHPGCRESAPAETVACGRHEVALPKPLRARLRQLYVQAPKSNAHREAVEEAIRLLKGAGGVAHG